MKIKNFLIGVLAVTALFPAPRARADLLDDVELLFTGPVEYGKQEGLSMLVPGYRVYRKLKNSHGYPDVHVLKATYEEIDETYEMYKSYKEIQRRMREYQEHPERFERAADAKSKERLKMELEQLRAKKALLENEITASAKGFFGALPQVDNEAADKFVYVIRNDSETIKKINRRIQLAEKLAEAVE